MRPTKNNRQKIEIYVFVPVEQRDRERENWFLRGKYTVIPQLEIKDELVPKGWRGNLHGQALAINWPQ